MKTYTKWGQHQVLWSRKGTKVKTIAVQPGKGLSFQKHRKRKELWLIAEGTATIKTYPRLNTPAEEVKLENITTIVKEKHTHFYINAEEWHQLINETDEYLFVVEIQFGEETEEDDIERLFYYEKNSD
jgi:mannose-6-phosphate isomerase-like protein (cupin superfamily)